jgi:hypothetical protein
MSRISIDVILKTGTLVYQASTYEAVEVEMTGTFGSVATETEGGVLLKTSTEEDAFKSEIVNPKFTLTGTGPVVIKLSTISGKAKIDGGVLSAS